VLFFKQIKDEKLSEPDFESFYSKECHICSLTMKVITQMEDVRDKARILERLKISAKDYGNLKSADRCNPEQVMRLALDLAILDRSRADKCPRLADNSSV
jgi:hypothetical protein